MKILLVLTLLSLSAWAIADDVTPPPLSTNGAKCNVTLGLMGSAKPIKLKFTYKHWAVIQAKGPVAAADAPEANAAETAKLVDGLVEIQSYPFGLGDDVKLEEKLASNMKNCQNSANNVARFIVYVRPQQVEAGADQSIHFQYPVDITLDGNGQGQSVAPKIEEAAKTVCYSNVESIFHEYFFGSTGKSQAFKPTWARENDPFLNSARSYCEAFNAAFEQLIYNQFDEDFRL